MTRALSRRGFLGVFGAGAIAGCGGGSGAASIAASTPTPAAPLAVTPVGRALPGVYHFFGPVQKQAALGADGTIQPPEWQFPGSALTPSTALFRFDLGVARALSATFRVCWTTESTVQAARLVHFDDGPQNIVHMATIVGRGGGLGVANNEPVDVTAEFNALRGGPAKNLGFQIYGDGGARFLLWVARLEITWEL